MDLGRLGVWWSGSWRVADDPGVDAAGELEALGFGTLWSSGGFEPRTLAALRAAAGRHRAAARGERHRQHLGRGARRRRSGGGRLSKTTYPGRFLLGVGASHAAIAPDYARPYSRMVAFLDALDALDQPVLPQRRILAALGPRMLELAAARAAGAHPYFVPVEHTAWARGDPRQRTRCSRPRWPSCSMPILHRAPALARALRQHLSRPCPTTRTTCARLGYGDDDIGGGGSDRLIDAVIPWGGADAVAARVRAHLDAGADHVCIQVVADHNDFPLQEYQELAPQLSGMTAARWRPPRAGSVAPARPSARLSGQRTEGTTPVRQRILLGRVHLGERPPVPALPGIGHEDRVVAETRSRRARAGAMVPSTTPRPRPPPRRGRRRARSS